MIESGVRRGRPVSGGPRRRGRTGEPTGRNPLHAVESEPPDRHLRGESSAVSGPAPSTWSAPRVALVTGGAAGIGRAEAVALAEAGADVAILGHTDLAGAEETARRCQAAGRRTLVVRADVRRSDEVRQAVEHVIATLGRLDVLVNNAGAL